MNIDKINERLKTEGSNLELLYDEEGLLLKGNDMELRGDFSYMQKRLKQSNLECEMLVRAVRIKGHEGPLNVIDATAGMGEDSLLLAAAGFNVIMYEYDTVIAALLEDTLKRAEFQTELSEIVKRMTLIAGDSIEAMKLLKESPDVILLDPMFPKRQKSGLIKKKFQLLQQLEKPCDNESELLNAAIMAKPKKIVIKRPLKGPYLAGRKPDYSYNGKAIRYDCIVFAK